MSQFSNHTPEVIDACRFGLSPAEEADMLAGAPESPEPTEDEIRQMGEAAGQLLAKPARKARKPRVKPVRTVRLTNPATAENPFSIITIVEGAKSDDYIVRPLASDWGAAYQVEKIADPQQKVYRVLLDGIRSSCDCLGHTRHGHCRHVESLTVLRRHNKL